MSLLRLLIDSERRLLLGKVGPLIGSERPAFYAGDKVSVSVSVVRPTGVSEFPFEFLPIDPADEVELLLGIDSGVPVAGEFAVSDGTGSVVVPVASTPAALETLLNSLPSVVSSGVNVEVEGLGSGYLIRHPLPASTLALSVDATQLFPMSAGVLLDAVEAAPGVSPAWLLRFERGAVATVTLTRETVTPSPSATPVVAWTGADAPAVVDLDLSGAFSGFANFTFTGLDADGNPATFSFPLFAGSSNSTAFSVINSAFLGATGRVLRVEQPTSGIFRVTHKFEPAPGSVNDGWSVSNSLVGFDRFVGELDLTDPDVEENLAGSASVAAVLEARLLMSPSESFTLAAADASLKSRLR